MSAPLHDPGKHGGTSATQVFRNLADPLQAAKKYRKYGFVAIPTEIGSHKPLINGWAGEDLKSKDVLSKFSPKVNVALRCGPTSGDLVDVDLDDDRAVMLAPEFLPETGCNFGREGRPGSHYLYKAAGDLPKLSFRPPAEFGSRPYVELRTDKCLVTVPCSIHPKDGSPVRFEPGKAALPSLVDPERLLTSVVLLAIACLVTTFWPKTKGNRHNIALALAGSLLRSGLAVEEARKVVLVATRDAGDDEYKDRAAAVGDTAEKMAAGVAVTGWPTLTKELGTAGPSVVEALQDWLRISKKESDFPMLKRVVITAKSLIASPVPEQPTIVGTWLKAGSVVLVYAQAKVGKTWLCLELAICVAEGRRFLGYEVNGRRKALYIDAEMSLAEKKERLDKLAGSTDRLLILDAHGFAQEFDRRLDLTNKDCQKELTRFVEEQGVELIVIDTLASLAPRRDENDNAAPELQSLMGWAQELKASNVSVVLIHHAGHEGRHPRGASALIGFVDTVIALRKRDDGLVEMEFTHTRDRKPNPDKLAFKINDGGDVVTLDVVQASKPRPEHTLLPHLSTGKYMTQAELIGVTGKSKGSISGWINKLRHQGLVEKAALKLTLAGKKLAKEMG